MPWKVVRDEKACSVSKPWAVKNSDTGAVNGRCHESKSKAEAQKRALYASYRKEGKSVQVEEFPQIVRAITGTPWVILPESLQTILDIVNMRLSGQAFSDEEIRLRIAAAKDEERDNPRLTVGGGVGVVSLYGPMFPKANLMTELSGATSLETFGNDFQELIDDPKVKQVVLDFHTPGGSSAMVHETGDLIRQGREVKPVYAIANTVAASGGLWLLSQATKAYATPSGSVGSLGVYATHEDISAQDEKLGRKITIVSAGEHKADLSEHKPLSTEGKQYIQESVDELHQTFIEEVAAGRELSVDYVTEHFANAKVFSAQKAKEIQMVDGVMSMRDLLDSLVVHNHTNQSAHEGSALAQSVNRMQSRMNSAEGGLLTRIESKEWEHSEPGTGNPPEPRKDGDGSDDPAITEEWRRPTPPPQDQPSGTSTKSTTLDNEGGGSKLNDTQLEELRRLYKLDVDADGDKIVEAAKLQFGELHKMKNDRDLETQKSEFESEYPLVWKEHNQLMETNRKHEADTFVSSVSNALKAESIGLRESRLGLSSRSKEAVSDLHIKLAANKELQTEFEQVMKTVMKGGLVPLGEIGSSKTKDGEETFEFDTRTSEGVAQSRNALAGLVDKHRKENPEMDYRTALAEVSAKYPELADSRKPIPA